MLISDAALLSAVVTSSPPRSCTVAARLSSDWRNVLSESSSDGKRSVRKVPKFLARSGAVLNSCTDWLTSVGTTSSAISTNSSSATSVMIAVASTRLAPMRSSLSATGSRK